MSLEFRTATVDEFAGAIDVVSTAFLDRPDLDRLSASVRETWDPSARGSPATATRRAASGAPGRPSSRVPGWRTAPGGRGRPRHRPPDAPPARCLRGHDRAARTTGCASWATSWPCSTPRSAGSTGATATARRRAAPIGRSRPWRQASVHGEPRPAPWSSSRRPRPATLVVADLRGLAHAPGRRDPPARPDVGLRPRHRRAIPWSGETWKGWVVVHRAADGTPDGYARYTAKNKEDGMLPAGRRRGGRARSRSTTARMPTCSATCCPIDLVREVVLQARPETDRSPWMLGDPRAAAAGVRLGRRCGCGCSTRRAPRRAHLRARRACSCSRCVDDEVPAAAERLSLDADARRRDRGRRPTSSRT